MKKLLFALALLPLAAQADWNQFEFNFEEKPWQEVQAELPAAPKEENLVPFKVSNISSNRFYVDALSLSVGSDGVMRYTLVVKSGEGALNVSYEGIRCDTAELKRYAFGRADGGWSKARDTQWQRIRSQSLNPQHRVLYSEYFCPVGIIVRNREEALDALKRGGHPSLGSSPS